MSAIILRDEIVHYEVLGRGRPTIFLHDWVGSWRYWIPCMQAASVAFRTYALDLWGFGNTAKNPSYYSIDQQISLLDDFLEELGIGKVALVGHGLGAVIGLLYATRRPALVDRILAVSLPPKESSIQPRLHLSPPTELADWLMGRTPATEAAWLEASQADPLAIAHSFVSLQSMDLAALPARSQIPCLIVHGLNDPAVTPLAAEQITALPEAAHAIPFESCGHFPMLDEPARFNRLLMDFLGLPSGASPRQLQLKEEWKRRVR